MIKRARTRKSNAPVIVFLAIAALFLFLNVRSASARDILHAAQSPEPLSNEDNYFVHWQSTTFQRINPGQIPAPDPYHDQTLSEASDTTILNVWLHIQNGNVAQNHTIEQDAYSGALLFENIFDGKQRIIYDSSGYLSYIPAENEPLVPFRSEVAFLDYAEGKDLKITGTTISEWGTEAWVIEEETGDVDSILSSFSEASKPYLTDLQITGFLYKWVIDKELERLVRFEWNALTGSGAVLLERTTYDKPLVINRTDLPPNWLTPSVPNAPVIDTTRQPDVLIRDLEQALASVTYAKVHPVTFMSLMRSIILGLQTSG